MKEKAIMREDSVPHSVLLDFIKKFEDTPTHFVTINLKKARYHLTCFEKIDAINAEETFHSFRRSLEAKIFSKTYRRRYKKHLPLVGSVEETRYEHRWHFHIVIKKPHFISDEDFENAIYETAKINPYVAPQKTHTIKIIALSEKTLNDIKKVTNYSVKNVFNKMNDNVFNKMKNISNENARFVM